MQSQEQALKHCQVWPSNQRQSDALSACEWGWGLPQWARGLLSPQPTHTPFPQWYPEVNQFCNKVPIVLVGCKTDLRKDKIVVKKLRKSRLEPVTYHRVGPHRGEEVPGEASPNPAVQFLSRRGT